MKSLKKILKYVLNYKVYAGLNIIFNIFQVIAELSAMLLFIPFLNLLFDQETRIIAQKPDFSISKQYFSDYFNFSLQQLIEDNNKVQALFYVCILVGVLFLLKNMFRYLAMFFIAELRTGVVRDLRAKIYNKMIALPLSFYSKTKKGDLISRITSDVQEVEFSILQSLEMIFREPINIILSLFLLIAISPELTGVTLLLLPTTAFIISRLGKSLKRTSTKAQNQIGLLLSNIEETLSGLKIIKGFNAEDISISKFKNQNNHYKNLSLRVARKKDLASPLSEFLGTTVMVGIAYFGGSLVLENMSLESKQLLNGGEFVTYIIIFARLLAPIKAFSSAYATVQKGAASADRIDTIISAENTIKESGQPEIIENFKDCIEYKNVTFSYKNEPVLHNINISIEKGKTIALVGESGGGKSTFADLLPRFYDLIEGEILIDNVNIKKITLKNLRNLMGIVTQESILFNDTIFNNIAFGMDKVSQEQVTEAATIANANQFISEFKNGYETNIGDRGGQLSGGQRQRLSIARAVLKNPPILILDEATSSLDTESEKLVQDALFKLMKNRTSIVIAHRLSTIQHADEIIVLQKGKIVERGTHTDLLKKAGVYKKLSDLQTFSN
jgi:subfamily B ATP-binding cassette protein MsbA